MNVTQPVEICICLPFCKVKARTEVYTIWCGFIQTHFSIPLLNRLPLIEYRALKTKNTEKKGVRKGWENSEDNFKSHCCYGNHLLLNGGLPSCLCLHHHVRTWTQQGDHSKTEVSGDQPICCPGPPPPLAPCESPATQEKINNRFPFIKADLWIPTAASF